MVDVKDLALSRGRVSGTPAERFWLCSIKSLVLCDVPFRTRTHLLHLMSTSFISPAVVPPIAPTFEQYDVSRANHTLEVRDHSQVYIESRHDEKAKVEKRSRADD